EVTPVGTSRSAPSTTTRVPRDSTKPRVRTTGPSWFWFPFPVSGTAPVCYPFMRSVLTLAAGGMVLALAACGGSGGGGGVAAGAGRPHIVVTTSMLGDIVRNVVGDQADVEVVMPIGADPHEFSPSARQAEAMEGADLLVVNGAGLEQSMQGEIDDAADVFTFADHVDVRTLDGGPDPHIWNDPHAMAAAA